MPVYAPSTPPDLSLTFPETDGLYPALTLSNGQELVDLFDQDIEVKTDEFGDRYYTTPSGVATLNLATTAEAPEQDEEPTVMVMRLRARNITPFYPEATESYLSGSNAGVIFLGSSPVGGAGLNTERVGTGDPTYAIDPGTIPVDASYQELRIRAEVGQPAQWYAFDPVEGPGPESTEGTLSTTDILFAPLWVTNINLNTNPEWVSPEHVRLYALDVWIDPQDVGMWNIHSKTDPSGNSGGWPLQHTSNQGRTGTWPIGRR